MLDANEAVGAMWIPQRMLLDPTQHSFRRVPGMPAGGWFPAIALPGAPLWGFTYRLLVDWLEISSRECAGPGFEVARMTLDFLRSRGLILLSPWHSTAPRNGDELGPAHAAKVSGPIPTDAVNRIFLGSGCLRWQSKPHRGTAGVHSHPRAGFRGVPDRSRHGMNVGTQPRTGFCHATGRGPRGVDSTNLGARVQNRSTLMTIALNTGLPFGKDKRGGS